MDTPRTAREIARRAIALHCTIAAAHGVSKQELMEWLHEEQLQSELTPRELAFFKQDRNLEEEVIRMTWMVEAQAAVIWSIGKLNVLPPPIGKCDCRLVISAMPDLGESTSAFVESAALRSHKEIQREETIHYDIHCRIDQAMRMGIDIPEGHDKDVVFFRHYGLCWVRGYRGQAWDEVTPDT